MHFLKFPLLACAAILTACQTVSYNPETGDVTEKYNGSLASWENWKAGQTASIKKVTQAIDSAYVPGKGVIYLIEEMDGFRLEVDEKYETQFAYKFYFNDEMAIVYHDSNHHATTDPIELPTPFDLSVAPQFAEENGTYLRAILTDRSYRDEKAWSKIKFFDHDYAANYVAKFEKIDQPETVIIETERGLKKKFTLAAYAIIHAPYDKSPTTYKMPLYETSKGKYFTGFTDQTTGTTSYQTGRYLNLSHDGGDTISIDFNRAYNPYCAYSNEYNCPLIPFHIDFEMPYGAAYDHE